MPRIKVKLRNPDGSLQSISRRTAFELIETTNYQIVTRRPLVIERFNAENYSEELRYLSGRKVPGATRGQTAARRRGSFSGQVYSGDLIRCRPPRVVLEAEEIEFRKWKARQLIRTGSEGALVAEAVMRCRRKDARTRDARQ